MNAGHAAAAALLCSQLAGCGACEPDPAPVAQVDAGGAVVAAPASALVALRASRRSALNPHPLVSSCRALAVEGEVAFDPDGGAAVAPSVELHGDQWLVLAANSRLVAKDPRTGRETTFRGPGRVRACVDSLEESWLGRGVFESSVGSGEAPGAEEWVVTPLGVVRFAAGQLSVEASAQDVRIRVAQGTAFVWVAEDAVARTAGGKVDGGAGWSKGEEGWLRLASGAVKFALTPGRTALEAARAGVSACVRLATSSRDQASAVLSNTGDAAASGAAVAEQVMTRRLARGACAVASLRVADLPPSQAQAGLDETLGGARTAWRALPFLADAGPER